MPNLLCALRRMEQPTTIQAMLDKQYPMALITGHLGRDPDVRYTASGKSIAKVSVAVSWGKRGEPDQLTEWIQIIAWERDAEILATFHRGDAIQVTGKMSVETWTGKDGKEHSNGQITAWTIARPLYRLEHVGEDAGGRKPDNGQGPETDTGGIPF